MSSWVAFLANAAFAAVMFFIALYLQDVFGIDAAEAGAVFLALTASLAHAQTNVRIRGTITAVSGNVMSVKSRDGRDLQITLPDNVSVAVAKSVRFDEIKDGDYVGVTTRPGPNNTEVALEVHYLATTTAPG